MKRLISAICIVEKSTKEKNGFSLDLSNDSVNIKIISDQEFKESENVHVEFFYDSQSNFICKKENGNVILSSGENEITISFTKNNEHLEREFEEKAHYFVKLNSINNQ